MNCQIIKDLLPLYIDECCSEESGKVVASHLECCPDCRKAFESMRQSCTMHPVEQKQVFLRSVSSWKASFLQSLMLFVSFAIMTLGVILEGGTPNGPTNGLWAVVLIIPATGYLLSLANWFFVRVYKNKKTFSYGSCIVTLAITLLGYGWAMLHYTDGIAWTSPFALCGIALSAVFCILSKLLSNRYALLLGRE